MRSRILGSNQIKWAADMWRKGHGTMAIAKNLRVDEARVYNSMKFIRSRLEFEGRTRKEA